MEGAQTWRVAVVGAGPAGFYATDYLLKAGAKVDLFERLPAPFGLLRYGVAPDHQNIKRAGVALERTLKQPDLTFIGNVSLGKDVSLEELLADYDQVLVATGSAGDRRMGIPGESLPGSVAATSFVGWYNAHPDFSVQDFDLRGSRAVVVGVGNVAMDVARVLVRSPADLAKTDIANYALEILSRSPIREVVLLGRRGPAQAAFDVGELKDIAALPGVELVLDGRTSLEFDGDPAQLSTSARRNLEFLATLPRETSGTRERVVRLVFCASPKALYGNAEGVQEIEIERTRLRRTEDGSVVAEGTGELERLETNFVVRAIGYRAEPVSGLPFDSRASLIPNQGGRAGQPHEIVPRCYVSGWIKRGPVGLLGSNKVDARETVDHMLEDRDAALASQGARRPGSVRARLEERGARVVDAAAWQRVDEKERSAGSSAQKVREKFATVGELLRAAHEG
ncbi:MAG TPA: FAD-dependent oxidoreductase [Polyangiaceae bacterium]|nr:FAD-dependent oxidoreductase [Polyangiaceae bacterium]